MNNTVGFIVWMLFLLALPMQLRTIIGEWRGEWTSFFLYGTDILLFLLLIFTPRWWQELRDIPGRWFLMAFVVLGAASLVGVSDVGVGLFRFLFLVKGIIVAAIAIVWFRGFPDVSFIFFSVAAALQAIIGIGQFVVQRDVGLRFFGESILSTSFPGVAEVVSNGVVFLRSYGATPHPNVLAAVVMTGFLMGWVVLFSRDFRKLKHIVMALFFEAVLVIALLFTFSRLLLMVTVMSVALLLLRSFFVPRAKRKEVAHSLGILTLMLVVFMMVLWPLWGARLLLSSEEQSVSLRSFYVVESVEVIRQHPFLGVGIGSSVGAFRDGIHALEPWVVQPVHSIYLLITSEMGLAALLLFLLFLIVIFRRLWRYINMVSYQKQQHAIVLGVLLLSFLFIGAFEHFFWTLQQGILLFWLIVGGLIGVTSRVDAQTSGVYTVSVRDRSSKKS